MISLQCKMKSNKIFYYLGQKIETISNTFASNLLKKRKGNALYPAVHQTKQAFKYSLQVLLFLYSRMSGKIMQLLIRQQGKLLT